MSLEKQLTESHLVQGVPSVQLHGGKTGSVWHKLRDVAITPFLSQGTTDNILGTGAVAYTEPNPVHLHGLPTHQQIINGADYRINDAPVIKGGCK